MACILWHFNSLEIGNVFYSCILITLCNSTTNKLFPKVPWGVLVSLEPRLQILKLIIFNKITSIMEYMQLDWIST